MRRIAFAAGLLLVCWLPSRPSGAQKMEELRARLEDAAVSDTLNDPQLMPWHLKLAVQLFDSKGQPAETGTIEEWWNSPASYRVDYTFPSYTGVEMTTELGEFHSPGPGAPPDFAETLLHQVTNPLPGPTDVQASTPDNRRETFGGLGYDCIMLDKVMKNVPYPPLGLFPTYCFERAHNVLTASFEYGNELTIRNKLGTFQKKTVPLALSISSGSVKVATAQVTALQGRPAAYPEAQDRTGLIASRPAAGIAGGIIAGSLISKPQPVYPQSAKDRHVSGVVILRAIIGRDGHIRRLTRCRFPTRTLPLRHWPRCASGSISLTC